MTAENRKRITEPRQENVSSFSVAATEGAATEVFFAPYKSGILNLPSTTTVTSVTFYVANTSGGTYNQLYNSSGSAVSVTIPSPATNGAAVALPAELEGAQYIKIVGNNADANAELSLKA